MNSPAIDKEPAEKSEKFLGLRGNNQEFKKLCRGPALALPTLILFLICGTGTAGTALATIYGVLDISYWTASLIMGVFGYFLFSVIHDASHRAFSRTPWINELMGNLGLLFAGTPVGITTIRRVHIQHHVYANGAKDPDHWVHHGSLLTLPFRWATFELFYVYFYFTTLQPRPAKEVRGVALGLIAAVSLVVTLISLGYGEEVLWLWFIPGRIAAFLIATAFVFLPHFPHEVAQNENPYRATTIRSGWEWLLTPLLAFQNYHLIHHLYPTAPFYQMGKIWRIKSKEKEFMDKKPAVVDAFGFTPKS